MSRDLCTALKNVRHTKALGRLQLHWFCNLMLILCLMTTFITLSKNQHYHIADEQTTYIGVQY